MKKIRIFFLENYFTKDSKTFSGFSIQKVMELFVFMCFMNVHEIKAQAPIITYSGGPKIYYTGTAINPLTPTNSGGAIPASIYGQVTTFAGSGNAGSADATGTAASFYSPNGVATDASGNLYIVDQSNHKIRKITPAGVVTTFAGNGTQGSTNATGTAASFNNPFGVATDASGNVYVADRFNHKIRKISPAGVVTTLAGSGTAGSINATGTAASFNNPIGVATDASGNVYVADAANNKIRKITPAGVVTTFAGSGTVGSTDATGNAASFNSPHGVSTDASGNVYVTDNQNNKIRKVSPAGVVTTFAGSGTAGSTDATGTSASFYGPIGVAIDISGNVYVVEQINNKIRKISPAGVVTTLAGSGNIGSTDATGTAASFDNPFGVATDASGNLYVGDRNNNKIRKINILGYSINPTLPAGLSFDGTTGIISGTPTVAMTATIYTITACNASGSSVTTVSIATVMLPNISYSEGAQTYVVGTAISPLNPSSTGSSIPASIYGQVTTFAGNGTIGTANGTGTVASFNRPYGVALDVAGNMYVADFYNNKIRKITPAGVVSNFAGSGTAGSTNATGVAASFYNPYGVATDASGNVYVADNANNKIRKITAAGVVTTLAGSGTAGSANGTGIAASFNSPMGIALDAAGNVYVADYNNHKIRKITSAGVVTTFAGSGSTGSIDGSGVAASFSYPRGVAIDGSGNIFVADQGNNKIRKITASGLVTTFAGSGTSGTIDGTGITASFNSPGSITIDALGNLFVTDYFTIRKISSSAVVTSVAGSSFTLGGSIDGTGADASFNDPKGLVADALGNLYVADSENNKIRKVLLYGYGITPALSVGLSLDGATGIISGTPVVSTPATTYTITGNNASGSGSTTISIATSLVAPSISYGASTQTFVTSIAINSLIPTNSGGIVFSYGQVATSSASVYSPNGITTDALGNTYVAEEWNHRIIKISAAGIVSTFANFFRPHGLTTDSLGNVYAGSANDYQIRKISAAGAVTNIAYISSYNGGIAVDAGGNVYVSAVYNVYKINPASVVTIFAGSSTAGFADGIGTAASFGYPLGLAIDSSGNVYVADLDNRRIRKITATGVVTSYAGNGTSGFSDGTSATASFIYPLGVATDYLGNVYVADSGVHKIRKISVNGIVSSFAGSVSNIPGAIDGIGSSARFYGVRYIATDLSGNVYATGEDYKVRKIYIDGYDITPSLPLGLNFDGITGTISGTPIVATAATEYTITAYNAAGSSSTTLTIATCSTLITPSFNAVGTICPGESLSALPTTSNNNIIGVWSPALNNLATTIYTFTPTAGQCATTAMLTVTVDCSSIINLKLYIEGYYDVGTSAMRSVKLNQGVSASSTDVETITLELHHAVNFGILETTTANLQTDGTAVCNFTNTPQGSYYIVVKGSNLIESWSNLPQSIGSTPLSYDFTTADTQAYGSNMLEVELGVWAFYSGDLNQDGNIDNSDYSYWEIDANAFSFGNFITDLNGDGNVDNTDFSVWETNNNNFIYSIIPTL